MAFDLFRLVIKVPLIFPKVGNEISHFVEVEMLMEQVQDIQDSLKGVFSFVSHKPRLSFYHQLHEFLKS